MIKENEWNEENIQETEKKTSKGLKINKGEKKKPSTYNELWE